MNLTGIIALLQTVVANLPGAITTVEALTSLGTKFYATINGHEPTDAEVAELRAMIDADLAEALTPLPLAQPGDPDYVPDPTGV